MSIQVACPHCRASYPVSDNLAGKKILCNNCHERFLVRPAPAAGKGTARKTADEEEPVEPADAEEKDAAAVRKGRPRPRPRDEVEEAAPIRRGRPQGQDDDDDDRPAAKTRRGKPIRKAKRSILPWVVGGGVLAGVLLLAGVAAVAWVLLSAPKSSGPGPNLAQGAPNAGSTPPNAGSVPPAGPPGQPAPVAPASAVVTAPAIKVALEYPGGQAERLLVADPDSHQAGVCFGLNDAALTHYFDRYDVNGGKRLSHTELPGVKVPQQMALSPDGSRLAVAEGLSNQGKIEYAITVWSLTDGQVLLSRWKPYPGGDPGAGLAWVAFPDPNHLLTLTISKQLSLWDLRGQPAYSVRLEVPGRIDTLFENFANHQPRNFALSADRGTVAWCNGAGFDAFDTATGRPRATTGSLVGNGTAVHGMALDRDGGRLAVYLRTITLQRPEPEDTLSVWDLKANRSLGDFPVHVLKEVGPGIVGTRDSSFGGESISWWDAERLIIWGGNGDSLVVDATAGRPVRELFTPRYGCVGFGDTGGRLWYAAVNEQKATLCAVDFPAAEAQRDQGLDEGQYYKRWWLTENGIESRAPSNNYSIFPRKAKGP